MARQVTIINELGRTVRLSVSVSANQLNINVIRSESSNEAGRLVGDGHGITVDLPDGKLTGWHPEVTLDFLKFSNAFCTVPVKPEIGACEARDPSVAFVFLHPATLN